MKSINIYGRSYVREVLNGIVMENCFPSVRLYVDSVREEFESGGYVSPADIHKLKQIYFRTNGDKPPPEPQYQVYHEVSDERWQDL